VYSGQHVSSLGGRDFTDRGKSQTNLSYIGGTIFADASTSYISLHHQDGFTAAETIHSKLALKREASTVGIEVKSCITDNGVYTVKDVTAEPMQEHQTMQLNGVGVHHQNGPAENAKKNLCFMLPFDGQKDMIKPMLHICTLTTAHMQDGLTPTKIWARSKSSHSHIKPIPGAAQYMY
jgi:hypothetical protein